MLKKITIWLLLLHLFIYLSRYPKLRGFRTKFHRNCKKTSEQQQQQTQQHQNSQKESSSSGGSTKKDSSQLVSQNSFEQPNMGKHEIKRGISHRSSDAGESLSCSEKLSRKSFCTENLLMMTKPLPACCQNYLTRKSFWRSFEFYMTNEITLLVVFNGTFRCLYFVAFFNREVHSPLESPKNKNSKKTSLLRPNEFFYLHSFPKLFFMGVGTWIIIN